MKRRSLLIISVWLFVVSSGFALSLLEQNSQFVALFNSSWVATLSLGPVWENTGDTQTFYLTPNIEKTYAANNTSNALIDGELFLGMQKLLRQQLESHIGLALATTSHAALSGIVWDDAQPQFNNYTYGYQVRHTHVALKGKLLMDTDYVVSPWVSGSLGVGFNVAHDFKNTPLISEAVIMPNFTSHTVTSFTYTLGVGIEHSINQHWQTGIGYEFADWGRSQLGRASGQTLNSGLSLAHLYTNGFLINLTYLA
jgi:opacity protein-like surface antigen